MFQKFHEQTLIARFIKHLLATEYVPSLQTIQEGSLLVAGCNYYYNDTIVECLQSGRFGSTAQVQYHIEQCLMKNFISNVSWYDEDTHKHLGTYLRYFRDKYSIDLMPYYNCYNSKELDDVYLKFTQEEMLTPEDDVVSALAPGTLLITTHDKSITDNPMKDYTTVDLSPWYDTDYVKNVFIEDGVTTIGSNAFHNCKGLVSITIPKTVTSIGTGAFQNCTNLLNVYYTGTAEEWARIVIGKNNSRLDSAIITKDYEASNPTMDTVTKEGDCGVNLKWKLDRDPYEVGLISCSPDLYVGHKKKQELMKFFVEEASADYRVVAVPVLFDTTYTVALSCDSDIMMSGVIYDNGMIPVNKLSTDQEINTDRRNMKSTYSEYLYHSIAIKRNTQFTSPFTFSIPLANVVFSSDAKLSETVKRELYQRQKYLYMIIQLPKNVETSIIVLEGDYTNKTIFNKFDDEGEVISNDFSEVDQSVTQRLRASDVAPLSLLCYNTGVSYAFSDRLIEYLLLNVIYPQETLSTNIANIQQSLTRVTTADGSRYLRHLPLCSDYKVSLENKSAIKGAWDDGIQECILRILDKHRDKLEYQYDHDGFVNKDVERLLSLLGVYRT